MIDERRVRNARNTGLEHTHRVEVKIGQLRSLVRRFDAT